MYGIVLEAMEKNSVLRLIVGFSYLHEAEACRFVCQTETFAHMILP